MLLLRSGRPRLLDLFCGAGGAGMGYYQAGFDVTGVDINPQPRYMAGKGWFIQGDALDYLAKHGREYDVIHASPPCQMHTQLKSLYQHNTAYQAKHKDFVAATRKLLQDTGKPYVIENTPNAPLQNPVLLCGSHFGLKVYRHRLFEYSFWMLSPGHAPHRDDTPAVGRGLSSKGFVSVTGTGGFGIPDGFKYACKAMGIDWMLRFELSQSIPPAYTHYVGQQLIRVVA